MLALAGLGALCYLLNPEHPWLYQGGFLLVPLLTGVLIFCSMNDSRFVVARLLRTQLAQWLGSRSYSLYLVHWLVLVWARLLGFDDLTDWPVLVSVLGVIALLSELMYRWVELPSKDYQPHSMAQRHMAAWVIAYALAALAIFIVTRPGWYAPAPEPARPVTAVAQGSTTPAQASAAADLAAASETETIIGGGEDIFAIGDSVLLGASHYLSKTIPGIRVDAVVGRQASQGLQVFQQWRSHAGKASTVVVHLGTSGYINESQYEALLTELRDREFVLLINVQANRRWTAPNNALIARLAPKFANVQVIDWQGLSAQRPEFFVSDGIHLSGKGMRALAAQIKNATGGAVITPLERDTILAIQHDARRKPVRPTLTPAPASSACKQRRASGTERGA